MPGLRHIPSSLFLLVLAAGFLFSPLHAQKPDSTWKKITHFQSNLQAPPKAERRIHKAYRQASDTSALRTVSRWAAGYMSTLGYAEFATDSILRSGDSLVLQFHTGPRYHWKSLHLRGLSEEQFLRGDFSRLIRRRSPFVSSQVEAKLNASLDDFQNSGYPFARFDSLQLALTPGGGDSLLTDVAWRFEPGDLVKIDTIIFEGKFRENPRFMQTLTGVRPGDLFDQSAINQIPRAMNNSIYFKNARTPTVKFTRPETMPGITLATVVVKAEPKRSGRFDLLLGLLPPREGETGLQFTGLVDIQLVSPFMKAGELFQFRFDKLPGSSQKLHLQYQQPYVFGSPLQAQFEFNMLKQDTIFLNRWLKFKGAYVFNPGLQVNLWYKNKSSSLISTEPYEDDTITVPPVLDGRDQVWGAGFVFDNLDYRFNPTKGWVIKADFGLGSKKIRKNPKLSDNLYRNLDLSQPKQEAEFEIQYYRGFLKRWVIMLANKTWWLNQEQYFENDLLQVGGSRSIRGFNENEFYTDFYTFFTAETRFILERNSWLFVFGDYAYLQNQIGERKVDHPLGVGIGMVYETKAGMVSLSYAIGKTDGSSFQPSRGRIHIGLINQF